MKWMLLFLLLPCLVMAQPKEPYCGNGEVEAPEECDNGNAEDGDGCSALCFRETLLYELRGDKDGKALDPNVAFRRSMVTTLFLPSGLGLIYGPSMGHLYAGEGGRAAVMITARALLLAAPVLTGLGVLNEVLDEGRERTIVVVSSSLVLSGLVALDLLDGPRAVERMNQKKAIIQGRAPKKKALGDSPLVPASTSAPSSAPN